MFGNLKVDGGDIAVFVDSGGFQFGVDIEVTVDTFGEEEASDQVFFLSWRLHGDRKGDVINRDAQADLDGEHIADRGKLPVLVKETVVFFNIHD